MCIWVARVQNKELNLPELELKVVVSYLMEVLGTGFMSSLHLSSPKLLIPIELKCTRVCEMARQLKYFLQRQMT